MRKLVWFLGLLLTAQLSLGQQKITQSPAATLPLNGTEIIPLVQGGFTSGTCPQVGSTGLCNVQSPISSLFNYAGLILPPSKGGTGVNNGSNTFTTSLPLSITGSGAQTLFFGNSGTPWTYNFPQATSTLAYQTSSWTSGNCLQAGNTAGLITTTAGACGSGG